MKRVLCALCVLLLVGCSGEPVPTSAPAEVRAAPAPARSVVVETVRPTPSKPIIPEDAEPGENILRIVPGSSHKYERSTYSAVVEIYTQYSLDVQPDNWEAVKAAFIEAVPNDSAVTKCNVYSKDEILLLSVSEERIIDQYEISANSEKIEADKDPIVYITGSGNRYHYSSTCNGGTYRPTTLSNAIAHGFSACNKCVH